jgi:hypothetical protein
MTRDIFGDMQDYASSNGRFPVYYSEGVILLDISSYSEEIGQGKCNQYPPKLTLPKRTSLM